jgi:hypothetical protein
MIQCDTTGGEPFRPVSVPDFGRSHTIVLVNLRMLHAHEVAFGEGTAGAGVGLAPSGLEQMEEE